MSMLFSLVLLVAGSVMASGIIVRHQRVLTFLATAAILFEIQWLFLTFLDRTIFQTTASSLVFTIGSVCLLLLWLSCIKRWSFPYFTTSGSGQKDAWIIPLLLIVLSGAWLISQRNGFENLHWISHGFFNGDVATFGALTQRSFLTTGLVDQNPFAGGGSLEYPTLLHAGVASLLSAFGITTQWLYFLPLLTYIQIFITIPIFFLLWDTLYPEPVERSKLWFGVPSRWVIYALQLILTGFVITLAWDNFVYPQSHFFLTASFLLMASLLIQAKTISKQSLLQIIPAVGIGIILSLSNAVTGTAAVAVVATFFALQVSNRKLKPVHRGMSILTIVLLMVLFILATPGNASFGMPHFSYTAALDMMRLTPIVIAIIVAIFLSLSYFPVSTTTAMVLFGLGFFTFFFSTRNIVVDNASRFFYHGILIGFPYLLNLLIRLFYWIRREVHYTTHSLLEQIVGWTGVIVVLLFFLFPAGSSVASTFDNLLYKDEQIVPPLEWEALGWIQDHIHPDAIFLTSPDEPFVIPFFTGRSMLRANYWLSPGDSVEEDVVAGFSGNFPAREQVLSQADYVYLRKTERTIWEPLPFPKVFDNSGVVIYKLR